MQLYETGFIISPVLSEEDTDALIKQMGEIVVQKQGKMIKQDIWGKRRLAYVIGTFSDGFYVFFTYEGKGDVPLELERRFKQNDAVLRFLTVKKDPRGLGQRRKKGRGAEAAPAEGASEAAPAEAPAAVAPGAETPAAEAPAVEAAPAPAETAPETEESHG